MRFTWLSCLLIALALAGASACAGITEGPAPAVDAGSDAATPRRDAGPVPTAPPRTGDCPPTGTPCTPADGDLACSTAEGQGVLAICVENRRCLSGHGCWARDCAFMNVDACPGTPPLPGTPCSTPVLCGYVCGCENPTIICSDGVWCGRAIPSTCPLGFTPESCVGGPPDAGHD